ncbi:MULTISPECIES: carbohydrate ABC transporter permease [unclassified Paenibacillus]|uniref:carbohydrate ABC transporter permease n=1 Tax=unclassified Paenibacillus TaxID=185978 RepID=UPI001C11A7B0|nr:MULTISPECIES: carbohydrate ABC transporter permease [unclassified Paenibacillus]MBU5440771.1 carbohydrate ABC transporter permease [Paenibacillus sp. MSJ-34]CAH0120373.1 L-arabinose transport system permease protein AraQ [Paenibacillus sp. CECT 9249]
MKKLSISKLCWTIVMALIGILFLLPFIWMLSASFKQEIDVFTFPIEWIPKQWNAIENYKQVWSGDFVRYYGNSIYITVATTVINVFVCALAAYGFSKLRFRGRDTMFLLVLALYMVPPQASLVPQFLLLRWFHLYDTHLGLILLNSFSIIGAFMLRQFFMSVSNEYIESGKIDGAGHFRSFFQIALPLIRPALATYAILRFIWTWNDYQNPLIFLKTKALFTIQLGISLFGDEYGDVYSLMMAGTVSAILPLLIIFAIGQKQVIEGISLGGVKG